MRFVARVDGVSLSEERRRRACGRLVGDLPRRGGAAEHERPRTAKPDAAPAQRCPKRPRRSTLKIHRVSSQLANPSGIASIAGRRQKRAAADAVEVSGRPNDAHTPTDRDVPEAIARDCARSCSLGRTRHLCKLLLSLGRLRAARCTLGLDPSLTPPTHTAHTARSAADAGHRPVADAERTHTKPSPIPSPATNRSPVSRL